MKLVRSLERLLVRVETVLLALFFVVMVVLAFSQVVLRNVFDTGLLWADPLVRHLVLWVGFLGAAVATHDDHHISIDALTKLIRPTIRSVIRVVTSVFAAVVCWFLASAALEFLAEERAGGSELALGIPMYVALSIIPVGYLLLMIHFLLVAVRHGHAAATGTDLTGEAEAWKPS